MRRGREDSLELVYVLIIESSWYSFHADFIWGGTGGRGVRENHSVSYWGWGTWDFPPLSSSFPSSFADFCHILFHPQSIMSSPPLPSHLKIMILHETLATDWVNLLECPSVHVCGWVVVACVCCTYICHPSPSNSPQTSWAMSSLVVYSSTTTHTDNHQPWKNSVRPRLTAWQPCIAMLSCLGWALQLLLYHQLAIMCKSIYMTLCVWELMREEDPRKSL